MMTDFSFLVNYPFCLKKKYNKIQGSTIRTARWPGASVKDARDSTCPIGPLQRRHESLSFACF